MTKEQLATIRARYADEPLLVEMRTDTLGNLITVPREHPIVTLLAEVERLNAERDAAFKRGMAAMREAVKNVLETHDPDEWPFSFDALPDPEDRTSTEGKP